MTKDGITGILMKKDSGQSCKYSFSHYHCISLIKALIIQLNISARVLTCFKKIDNLLMNENRCPIMIVNIIS